MSKSKQCEFCGRFFVPNPRVGDRQRACSRPECKKARKQKAQREWLSKEPDYFTGRYLYVKEWRQKRRLTDTEVIQDKISPAKPCRKLVFILPATKNEMIQDEIMLKRVDSTTFAAHGLSRRMIQDTMATPG